MIANRFMLLAACWATLAVAGCSDIGSLGAEAKLDYSGNQSGSHSEVTSCDDEGRIRGTGSITDGNVDLRVTDADGTELFERRFEGSFTLEETTLRGDSGDWKIEATRHGDDLAGDPFNGNYEFWLNC